MAIGGNMKVELDTITLDEKENVAYLKILNDDGVLLSTESIGFLTNTELEEKVQKKVDKYKQDEIAIDDKKAEINIILDSINTKLKDEKDSGGL